ncbi:MAG TPA: hypothetical protein VIG66_08230 [Noviherbaspirillum sp.]
MTPSTLAELQQRWYALNDLAGEVNNDERRLSTALDHDDPLMRHARACGVRPVTPLTVGTLLAEILSELDGIELAIESVRRELHPGEDQPDPLAGWRPRRARDPRLVTGNAGSH